MPLRREVVVDDTPARAAAMACRRRVQRGRMLADDGLRDTPATVIRCWCTTCSQLARFEWGSNSTELSRHEVCAQDCSCDELLVH